MSGDPAHRASEGHLARAGRRGGARRAVPVVALDHVSAVVADVASATAALRRRHGLGSVAGMHYDVAGTWHHYVPLNPPQLLELLVVERPEVAASTETGRRVLEAQSRGDGPFAWCVLVDDLDAVSARLGIPVVDYTLEQPDGTLRGWRTVTGPAHLPFFIDYPRNGDRAARLRALYDQARHESAPSCISGITVSGSAAEHREWLGPHDLPLRYASGTDGIVEAVIATERGSVIVREGDAWAS